MVEIDPGNAPDPRSKGHALFIEGEMFCPHCISPHQEPVDQYLDGIDQWQPHISHRCDDCGNYFVTSEPMVGKLPPQAPVPVAPPVASEPVAGEILPIHSLQFTLEIAYRITKLCFPSIMMNIRPTQNQVPQLMSVLVTKSLTRKDPEFHSPAAKVCNTIRAGQNDQGTSLGTCSQRKITSH